MRIDYPDIAEHVASVCREYLGTTEGQGHRTRQLTAARKLRMDRGHFRAEVCQRIDEIYEADDTKEKVKRHISLETNPLQRTTDAVSIAYKVPPVRRVGDASSLSASLEKALKKARFNAAMRRAARVAFQVGVAWVRPHAAERAKGLTPECEIITPATAIDAWYGSDPCHPDVLLEAYEAADNPEIKFAVYDAEAIWYLDARGEMVDGREHGMAMPPLAEVRTQDRAPDDYWAAMVNDRLFTATIDVARLIAHIRWVRKSQSYYLQLLAGQPVRTMSKGQRKNPEGPIVTDGHPDTIELKVHNLDLSVKNAEEEISSLLRRLDESYGTVEKILDNDPTRDSSAGVMTPKEHAALADIRARQIEPLREADVRGCVLVARAAELSGMSGPTGARVEEDLEVDYAPLAYVDDPLRSLEVAAEEIKLGQLDHVGLYMRRNPGVSREVAEKRVRAIIETRNEFIDLLSKHQIPADPREEGELVAAKQGRIGGLAKPDEIEENDPRE